ncbi:trypsin-like peptidase domain-containing protein [Salipiger sp. 1_MG-2023]|uniref:trypsin-like peptidase domain-containing protein n=1 Tax=Salipiger sp. 1_MG-2023 TaxID=3062665 RepID=UPI0026E30C64|nr:trypsin-like peptidase domain-containing protein [Salipiger sp. 1_MG-2023]MDO6584937.1 trypsin-like peptidase domain-containing protein [Salipiger sp. 1_MG-2023]
MASAAALLIADRADAQETVYIQIEAQPSLREAEDAVRGYAAALNDVNGFTLGGGWYGIALGPYAPDAANAMLRQLRGSGRIPSDAYLAASSEYRDRFFPVGGVLNVPDPAPAPQVVPVPQPQPQIDESPREARASEARLTHGQREMLQVALKWAGVYTAGIDGAFGAGTRRAMADWQARQGYDVTGVLTTLQRADLLGQYNAVLDGLDMAQVNDSRAGISIEMPTGAVAFDRYEAPFAIYEPSGDLAARVLLISQPGDRQTLNGLYEIMQTLEIVPPEGARTRNRDGFVLTGANARLTSHTEVTLQGGQIKGWTLIWPAGDAERQSRVMALMKASFATLDGVLDPAAVSVDGQAVDLVSGLQVRQPRQSVSGFFVSPGGAVVTAAEAVAGCGRVTLDGAYEATVAASDAALGVALLQPAVALAPRGVAAFGGEVPRLKSEISVAGYSFGGVLSAPTLTWGTIEDMRGLNGEESVERLAVATRDGDSGGPVLDMSGAVLGMLLPKATGAAQLPAEVGFAADAEALRAFLSSAGVQGLAARGGGALAPEDLTATATAMTVKVSCWE